jgi:hypothetical protein
VKQSLLPLVVELPIVEVDIGNPLLHTVGTVPRARGTALPQNEIRRSIKLVLVDERFETLPDGVHRILAAVETGVPAGSHHLPDAPIPPIIEAVLPREHRHAFPPIAFLLRDRDQEHGDCPVLFHDIRYHVLDRVSFHLLPDALLEFLLVGVLRGKLREQLFRVEQSASSVLRAEHGPFLATLDVDDPCLFRADLCPKECSSDRADTIPSAIAPMIGTYAIRPDEMPNRNPEIPAERSAPKLLKLSSTEAKASFEGATRANGRWDISEDGANPFFLSPSTTFIEER